MTNEKENIVYLGKDKLVAYQVTKADVAEKTLLFESFWSKDNLKEILEKLKAKLTTNRINLLLSDSLVFTLTVTIPHGEEINRDSVKKQLQGFTPVNLDKTIWDFKEIELGDSSAEDQHYVQVTVLTSNFAQLIQPAMVEAGLDITKAESLSVALAKSSLNETEPIVLVYGGLENLITLTWRGQVFISLELIPVELSNKVKILKDFADRYLKKEIKKCWLVNVPEENTSGELKTLGFTTEINEIDPIVGVSPVVMSKPSEKPESVELSPSLAAEEEKPELPAESQEEIHHKIWEEKTTETEEITGEPETSQIESIPIGTKTGRSKKILLIPMLLILIIVIALPVWWFILKPKTNVELFNPLNESGNSSQNVSDSQASASAQVKLTDLTVQVLNGSGVAGEAAKVQGLLEKAGFNVVKIGNAPTKTKPTLIESKLTLPETVKQSLMDSLGNEYELEFSVNKAIESDIVIEVGNRK